MMLDGKAAGSSLPGTGTITVAGIGGLSTSTSFTVEDNPYIDTLTVSFPSSIYASTPAEFTVSAVDQYGDEHTVSNRWDEAYRNDAGDIIGVEKGVDPGFGWTKLDKKQ